MSQSLKGQAGPPTAVGNPQGESLWVGGETGRGAEAIN